jgi:hypothetical protein
VAAWTALWEGNTAPTDNINQLISDDVATTSLTTSQLDPTTFHQVAKAEDDLDLPGTSVAEMLPPQCSAGITWLTGLASKRGRGRMYLPPYSTATVDAGSLASADVTITLNAGRNLYYGLAGAGFAPIVFGRHTGVGQAITSIRVGDVFNTQRGRRDKLVPAYQSANF